MNQNIIKKTKSILFQNREISEEEKIQFMTLIEFKQYVGAINFYESLGIKNNNTLNRIFQENKLARNAAKEYISRNEFNESLKLITKYKLEPEFKYQLGKESIEIMINEFAKQTYYNYRSQETNNIEQKLKKFNKKFNLGYEENIEKRILKLRIFAIKYEIIERQQTLEKEMKFLEQNEMYKDLKFRVDELKELKETYDELTNN